jgi:Skp family chaperone for outer membrane proteins
MKKNVRLGLSGVLVLCVIGVFFTSGSSAAKQEKSTRIGVFDSRAVAIAYVHSKFMKQEYQKLKKQKQKAQSEGDTKRVNDINKEGENWQHQIHKQAFGTASVSNLLKYIKEDLPEIAEKSRVDIIISKWDIEYKSPSAEVIDITNKIIEPFNPDEKTLEKISGLSKEPPISDEILNNMKD